MPEIVRRGFMPTDEKEFNEESTCLLRQIQKDAAYLVDRGYELERSVTFLCNRFGLSARQRMALRRSTVKQEDIGKRISKAVSGDLLGRTVYLDGFNQIIMLEAALSGTVLLLCMDGTVRDLAGIHGNYRLIDKTDAAISLIYQQLIMLGAAAAVFYLDAPVSNSGRLRQRILELSRTYTIGTEVELLMGVDKALYNKECVVTSDGVVLDHCVSWVNLGKRIIEETFPEYPLVDLSGRDL